MNRLPPSGQTWLLLLVCCVACIGRAAPAAAECVPDGEVAVSTNLAQAICEIAPQHVDNAACCSGKASPVWNPSTAKCDTTCDSSNPCDYVTCTATDQCHVVGTCDPNTGICSNPTKANDTPCSDSNSCTVGDVCVGGTCASGALAGNCCGNGAVEAGEQCDDRNQSGNPPDGCSGTCMIDPTWACTGEPSNCCLGADVVRFELPELSQNQCESIKAAPDAGCCQGSHKGVWTGAACNVVCSVNKCNPAPGWGSPADYGCFSTPCIVTGPCDPNDGCTRTQAPAESACGTGPTTCSGQDTCDAAAVCQPNDVAAGTTCAWPSECVVSQCDGTGGCVDASDVLNGQSCDDGDLCTTFDQCVSGTCVGGEPADCAVAECYVTSPCEPQVGCSATPAPAGTPCGNASQDECRLDDTCDGAGACAPNFLPDGTPCGGTDGSCFTLGTCSNGTCSGGAVPLPADTPCRDVESLGDCDAGDTCDGAGSCLPNLIDGSVVCRPDAGACDVEERCDGADPSCPTDAFEPAGTTCGEPTSIDCSDPDECDGAGSCQPCDQATTTTTTSTTTATSVVTTTTPPQEPCTDVTGITRARCLVQVALGTDLCGDPMPAKLDGALRVRLERVAERLEVAAASENPKRARSLKKARRLLTVVGRKAARASKAKRTARRISASCANDIALLVDSIALDAS